MPNDVLPREPGSDDGYDIAEQDAADRAPPRSKLVAELEDNWKDFTADQLRSNPPPPRYVWEPRIPAEKVVLLSATGGSYKTTLLTYLCACRATGKPFLDGTRPTVGETVIFTLEDGAEDYWRKLAAIRIEWGDGFDAELIAKRVHIIDAVGLLNMKMVAGEFGQYAVTELPDKLAEVIKSRAPATDLIIIETTSRVGAGENNDALSALICAAERLARLTHAAVVLVTHVSQDAARSGIRDQHSARGGTAQSDNARGTLNISRLTNKDAKELLPGANLSMQEMERLIIFDHSKGWTSGPRAKAVILERHYNEQGPVLRLADLSAKPVESSTAKFERLRVLVERLTLQGVTVTSTKLRDYTDDLGTTKPALGRLLTEAEAAKAIRFEKRKGRGGGEAILANPAQVRRDWTGVAA